MGLYFEFGIFTQRFILMFGLVCVWGSILRFGSVLIFARVDEIFLDFDAVFLYVVWC